MTLTEGSEPGSPPTKKWGPSSPSDKSGAKGKKLEGASPAMPWTGFVLLVSVSAWCLLGWRQLDLEWRFGRLEGDLEAQLTRHLERRLLELGVDGGATAGPGGATHSRVVRQVAPEACVCPPGQ
ncbi:uncharacterized protein LOC143021841 [Oratosquilla oratoria]|uniref:uncharacterized protein LOC143021841 n=1 Tax=Oratosquilla oratoria TaxID=337810 RepID=UPI003F76D577